MWLIGITKFSWIRRPEVIFKISDVAQPVKHPNICFLFLVSHFISSLCLSSSSVRQQGNASVCTQAEEKSPAVQRTEEEWVICLCGQSFSLFPCCFCLLLVWLLLPITVDTLAHSSGVSGIFDTFHLTSFAGRHSHPLLVGRPLINTQSVYSGGHGGTWSSRGGLLTVAQVFQRTTSCCVPMSGYSFTTSRSKMLHWYMFSVWMSVTFKVYILAWKTRVVCFCCLQEKNSAGQIVLITSNLKQETSCCWTFFGSEVNTHVQNGGCICGRLF